MDFSFVLNDYVLDEKRLKAFGFKRKAGAFLLEKPIEKGEDRSYELVTNKK